MEVIHLLSDQENDEVIFVEHRKFTDTETNHNTPFREATNSDHDNHESYGDVLVVAEHTKLDALVDYPHFRFHCAVHAFNSSLQNCLKHCDMCFCYICDSPAAQCQRWKTHCRTTDQQVKSVEMRERTLRRRQKVTTRGSVKKVTALPR